VRANSSISDALSNPSLKTRNSLFGQLPNLSSNRFLAVSNLASARLNLCSNRMRRTHAISGDPSRLFLSK
jgi:hypothetical protein